MKIRFEDKEEEPVSEEPDEEGDEEEWKNIY